MRRRGLPVSLLGGCLCASIGLAADRLRPDDLWTQPAVDELDATVDGGRVAWVTSRADRATDAFLSSISVLEIATGAVHSLTRPGDSETAPRFSPDGERVALLATDKGHADQIVVVNLRDSRRRIVTSGVESVSDFAWSPDGATFAFSRLDARSGKAQDSDPIVIRRWQTQWDGQGFLDERRHHLWIVPVAGGPERQISTGRGDDREPRFSPDGRSIAFVSNRDEPDPDRTDDTDLYVVHPDGSALTRLASSPGPDDAPRWSHAGDRIAFVGTERADDSYPVRHLYVTSAAPAAGGISARAIELAAPRGEGVADESPAQVGRVAAPFWSDDDATVTTAFDWHGATFVGDVASTGGELRPRAEGRTVVGQPFPVRGGGFVALLSDATHPAEAFLFDRAGNATRQLTHVADPWLRGRALSTPEKLTTRSADGTSVEAWLYPPADLDPARRYPMILYVHGGPQGFDGDFFDSDLENQVFPAAGYALLRVNYRGGDSYGSAFAHAIEGDWHRREFEDLMAAVDAAIATRLWIDPDRLGIGGWSYGGMMTLWTVGHTDRFKVGVPERFAADYLSAFGEDQWFLWSLSDLGDPMTHEELYRRLSPITYLRAVRTPLYLIADEDDRNCPLSQVLQVYQRLKLLGQATELVIYPDESHALSRPSHLVDRLNRLLAWFGRYLHPGS